MATKKQVKKKKKKKEKKRKGERETIERERETEGKKEREREREEGGETCERKVGEGGHFSSKFSIETNIRIQSGSDSCSTCYCCCCCCWWWWWWSVEVVE